MPKTYKVKEKTSSDLVEQLLHNRGIKTTKDREKFLKPDFEAHLHDPFLLPDMEKAMEKILHAIDKGEKVAIWSDYDADGIPGGALLHDFFKLIGFNNFINYIPDRHNEGYGLNMEGMEKLKEDNVKLLITVDCGTRNFKEISFATKSKIDVIVTDHHEPKNTNEKEELPEAFAVVNHKRIDSKYPESVLCGSGIIWKLIEAILKKRRSLLKEGQEKWLLDLAGIATLSDMVPLVGENRVLAYFGLTVLRKTKRLGLNRLYNMLKINKERLTEDDIGFLITPRINAASRMGVPKDAFDLLISTDEVEAEAKALHLDKINNERKGIVAGIVKEAKKHIKNRIELSGEKPVIVFGDVSWRPSLLGLAANSIAEEYKRPVFLWGREGGENIKGSCRSDGVTDLVALMERAGSSFSEFGGHKFSGGFSVDFEKIHTLEEALVKAYLIGRRASIDVLNKEPEETRLNDKVGQVWVDSILKVRDVNIEKAEEINKLAPFGIGNEKPIFVLENVIPEKISRFGKGQEHLSLTIRDGGHTAKAISFFTPLDKFGDVLVEGKMTNLVANLELSYWNNRPETRLRIIDFFC